MAVTRVVDRDLVIEISDPAHQKHLASYDQNSDGKLTIDDFRLPVPFGTPQFGGPSDGVVRHFMQESVAEAFVDLGLVEEGQRDAFVRYFDRYNAVVGRVAALRRLVPAMVQAPHTDGYRFGELGPELQLLPGDWKSRALPVLAAGGDSGSSVGYQLSTDLYRMIVGFVVPEVDGRRVGRGCNSIDGFTYDGGRIPEVIAGQTEALLQSWNEIRSSFGRYTQIECEGKGCPEEDEVHLFFIQLGKGAKNDWHSVYCKP